MDRLRRLEIIEIGLTIIMTLYEILSSWIHTLEGISYNIHNTIGVNKECLVSLTLFGLYVDKFKSILGTVGPKVGFFLHSSHVPILLFVDDIVLLSHTIKGNYLFGGCLGLFQCQARSSNES